MPSVNGNLYFGAMQNMVDNFVISLQLGHLLFIFAVLVPKDSDCDHKMRISFYDKIEVLKVVFVTPQHRLKSFSIFHEKKKTGSLGYDIQVHLFVLILET